MLAPKQTWRKGLFIAQIIILNDQITLKVSIKAKDELPTIDLITNRNAVAEPGRQNTNANKKRQGAKPPKGSQYHGTVNRCTLDDSKLSQ